jgi:hypothetical protein
MISSCLIKVQEKTCHKKDICIFCLLLLGYESNYKASVELSCIIKWYFFHVPVMHDASRQLMSEYEHLNPFKPDI